MVISKRLQQIADMVTPGHIPADIGTDHAYVPIHLLLEQKAGKAYAMDIGAGPLDRAREHIRAEGLVEKIEVRQSDGLKELKPGEADTVIIAGMGGALTVRILTDGMHVLERVRELVLSPHSEIEKVREWVLTHGFEITDEEMLIDDGKFYTVLRAERTGIPGEPAQGEIAFGEGTQGDIRNAVGHLQAHLHLSRCLQGVGQVGGIGRMEIEISIVSQQVGDTVSFSVECGDIERRPFLEQRLLSCAVDKHHSLWREIAVFDRIECEERSWCDDISHLLFLFIFGVYHIRLDGSSEIAMSVKGRLCYRCPQVGVDRTH